MWKADIQKGCQSLYFSLVLCMVEEVFMAVLEIAVPLFKIETVQALMRIVARRSILWVPIIRKGFVLLRRL